MAPIPPSCSILPVAASTINEYGLSFLGYATTGSEHKAVLSSLNAFNALSFKMPPLHTDSLRVSWLSGLAMAEKFLTWARKKLQSPKNCLT